MATKKSAKPAKDTGWADFLAKPVSKTAQKPKAPKKK